MRKLLLILFSLISVFALGQSTDNFNSYADASNLDAAANWVTADGATDAIKVYNPTTSAGSIYSNSSGDNCAYYVGTFDNDQYAQIKFTASTGGKWVGIAVRATSTSGGSYYAWLSDNSYSYFVEMNNGSPAIGTYWTGNGWTVDSTYKMTIEGSEIRFYHSGDGTNFVLDVSMSSDGIFTDATITTGNPGVSSYSLGNGTRGDDWKGGDLSAAALSGGTIAASQTFIGSGDPAAFTSTLPASGGTGSYTYSWIWSTSDPTPDYETGTIISSNTTTYDVGVQTDTSYWIRMVNDGSTYAYSNPLTITVTPAEEETPATGSYTGPFSIIKDARISHKQYYIIPETYIADSDYVGQFYVNCTDSVFNSGGETYTYSITAGNTASTIKIKNTGMLYINESNDIHYGTNFSLIIKVTDTVGTDRQEYDTAIIYVAHADSCRFINLDAGVGTGTHASPWNTLNGVTFTSGYYYFIERATTSPDGDHMTIYNASSPTKWVSVTACGVGVRPIIDGTGSSEGQAVMIGLIDDYPTEAEKTRKVFLSDIQIRDYTASGRNGIRIGQGTTELKVSRCYIDGSNDNSEIFIQKDYNNLKGWRATNNIWMDIQVDNSQGGGHGFKAEAGGNTVTNLWGSNNNRWLISNPWSSKNKYYYIHGTGNGQTGGGEVQFRNSQCELRWGVFRSYGNIDIRVPTESHYPDSCTISDVYMVSTYYSGIYLSEDRTGGTGINNTTIRRFIFSYTGSLNASVAGVNLRVKSANTTIEKSIFYGNPCSGVILNNTDITNTTIINNLFFDNNYYGVILMAAGTGTKIDNNTAYNNLIDFQHNSTNNVEFMNNSYQTRNSSYWSPIANNYVYSADPYSDKANDIYYPAVGSPLIDAGYEIAYINTDIMGNARNLIWDIGCFEYQFIVEAAKKYYWIGTPKRKQVLLIGNRKRTVKW